MAKFEKCPHQKYLKQYLCKSCDDYEYDHCDGCNMYTSYLMGRADALQEAIEKQKPLVDK